MSVKLDGSSEIRDYSTVIPREDVKGLLLDDRWAGALLDLGLSQEASVDSPKPYCSFGM